MRAYSLTILNSFGLSVIVQYCAINIGHDVTIPYVGTDFVFTRIYVKLSYEKNNVNYSNVEFFFFSLLSNCWKNRF